ncbi:MAG: ECF transporter S component, partial [Nanoarchaeota archaeon]|nr:ECF transporter S component [Nanoarchaeota archaeon]
IPMQAVPSAEPITFFAILSGWLFGKKKGFITGAAAGYMSNFLMFGGQGPWSIFQCFAWGLAGFLGGFIKDIKPSKNYFLFWARAIIPVVLISVLATLLFDTILNVSWIMFMPYSIFALFLSGLPFLLVHLVSNAAFSLFLPFARKIVYEKGKFNELDICHSIIRRINNHRKPDRAEVTEQPAEQ